MVLLGDLRLETLLEAGYAVALLLVALGLEWAARLTHRRAEEFQTAGFHYHAALDVWECPTGERLLLTAVDYRRRLVRYQARATACNQCPLKSDCTDRDDGRELLQSLDAWPRSELARFYRGLSLTLIFLGAWVIGVGLVRNHDQADMLLLGSILMLVLGVGQRLWPTFRQPRASNFGGHATGVLDE